MMLETMNLSRCNQCGDFYSAELAECPRPSCAVKVSSVLSTGATKDLGTLQWQETPRLWQDASATFTPLEKVPANSATLAIETPQKGVSMQASNRLRFFVPVNPMPKERPRFGGGKTYTSQKTKDYEAVVQHYANVAIAEQGYIMPNKDTPLMAILHFYRKDKIGVDADNLQKAIMDALNHTDAYADDKQVLAFVVTLERGSNHMIGASVEIRPYFPELSILENLDTGE